MKLNKVITILFFILVVINALDVMTTLIGMQLGAVESKSVTEFLMMKMGVIELLLFKFFAILIVGFIAVIFQARSSLHPLIFMAGFLFGIGYLTPIVLNNLIVIWSLII